MKKKSDETRLASVLSLRVPAKTRSTLVQEARGRGKKLSDHLFDLLALGIEASKSQASGNGAGPQHHEEAEPKPTVQPKQPSPQADGQVDQEFLDGIKKRFPSIDHDRLLRRLDDVLAKSGKQRKRKDIENLFRIASQMRGKS